MTWDLASKIRTDFPSAQAEENIWYWGVATSPKQPSITPDLSYKIQKLKITFFFNPWIPRRSLENSTDFLLNDPLIESEDISNSQDCRRINSPEVWMLSNSVLFLSILNKNSNTILGWQYLAWSQNIIEKITGFRRSSKVIHLISLDLFYQIIVKRKSNHSTITIIH